MINKIIFPKNENTKYYESHYAFILNSAKYLDLNIEYSEPRIIHQSRFAMTINNKDVIIDFRDHTDVHPAYKDYDYYFKYHKTEKKHNKYKKLFPLGAISFLNWERYLKLKREIKYRCNNDIILNNQRVFGNAKIRRPKVRTMLKEKYGSLVNCNLYSQEKYWKLINNCLVSVCVPGARNDMLDRGQLQYMAFGCCTISPYLKTILAYNKKLIPGTHYIACKDDYSDLIPLIEWCKKHRKQCIKIGKNAQKLFLQTSIPKRLWNWIDICLNKERKL